MRLLENSLFRFRLIIDGFESSRMPLSSFRDESFFSPITRDPRPVGFVFMLAPSTGPRLLSEWMVFESVVRSTESRSLPETGVYLFCPETFRTAERFKLNLFVFTLVVRCVLVESTFAGVCFDFRGISFADKSDY